MKCSIYEAYEAVNVTTEVAILYTDSKGLQQMKEGNSFYVWTRKYAKCNDIELQVFKKDLAEDIKGNVYCVDSLDVRIMRGSDEK